MHGFTTANTLASEKTGLFTFEYRLFRLERTVCALALAVMLFTVSISVVVRYFNLPVPNVAEWALVSTSPLTFVGAAMCSYAQAHIAVDIIKLVSSPITSRAVRGFTALCLLAFSGVYAWLAWMFLVEVAQSGEKLLDMGTPVYVPVFFLLAGMVLMVFHAACELWRVITNRISVNEEML